MTTTRGKVCLLVQPELTEWSLGGLPPDRHLAVDTHLMTCAACLEDALSLRRLMCSDGSSEALPELEAAVLTDFRAMTRGRVFTARPVLTGIAVALAASVLLAAAAMFFFRDQNRASGTSRESAPMSMEHERIFSDQATIL